MSKLSVNTPYRRVPSSALWIALTMCIALGTSAGLAFAAEDHKLEICHKGQTISVDVHAAPAHLEHGDLPVACEVEGNVCGCGLDFDPITCVLPDGTTKTFANECLARCAGATGNCPRLGICTNIWNPVSCNGVIYANLCQAALAGAVLDCPLPLCACPLIYAPVHCTDGRTFVNSCVAQCLGQSICTPL
jgi:hypothetical protein